MWLYLCPWSLYPHQVCESPKCWQSSFLYDNFAYNLWSFCCILISVCVLMLRLYRGHEWRRFIYWPVWPPAEEARRNRLRGLCHSCVVNEAVVSIILCRYVNQWSCTICRQWKFCCRKVCTKSCVLFFFISFCQNAKSQFFQDLHSSDRWADALCSIPWN